MRDRIFSVTIMICLCLTGCAHTRKPPLVLEPNKYSYTFGVPKGWDFSFEKGNAFNVRLVFFPVGGNIHISESIIYVNEVLGFLDNEIDRVLENAKASSPILRIETIEPIPLSAIRGASAQVRILTGASDPRQAKEALVFIDHGAIVVIVVLTTKNTAHWQEDYRALEAVVAGHQYYDCNSPNLAVPCR